MQWKDTLFYKNKGWKTYYIFFLITFWTDQSASRKLWCCNCNNTKCLYYPYLCFLFAQCLFFFQFCPTFFDHNVFFSPQLFFFHPNFFFINIMFFFYPIFPIFFFETCFFFHPNFFLKKYSFFPNDPWLLLCNENNVVVFWLNSVLT